MAAAKAFFESAKLVTGVTPDRVTTDGHDSYPRAIRTVRGTGVRHTAVFALSTSIVVSSAVASLKRHIATDHQMTPDEYRTKWGLPPSYLGGCEFQPPQKCLRLIKV
jgi:hypothetical protein